MQLFRSLRWGREGYNFFFFFFWLSHFKIIRINTVGVNVICELPDRLSDKIKSIWFIMSHPRHTVKIQHILNPPHIFQQRKWYRKAISGRRLPFSRCNRLPLEKSLLIIRSAQLLWFSVFGDTERWLAVQRCWNLYWIWAFERRTLHMPKHLLPTKAVMHVNLTQWMVPLVRDPINYCETGSRVLGHFLVWSQFPTPAPLRFLSPAKQQMVNLAHRTACLSLAFISNYGFSEFRGWVA